MRVSVGEMGGRTALGAYVEVPQGGQVTVDAAYELALNREEYSLVATPQPLARDARLRITLAVPDDWVIEGPGEVEGQRMTYDAPFAQTVVVEASPSSKTGLSRLWDGLADFWNEPLF